MKFEMSNQYINYDKKSHTFFELIILICWILFSIFSTYEGYLPGSLGGITRYILLFWLVVMALRVGRGMLLVKIDQFLWLIWWSYYFVSLVWTDSMSQALVYVFTVTLMVFLCVFIQYFCYSIKFCEYIIPIFKSISVSVAFLSLFFFVDIGAGTRRVLYLFNTYVDPNGQVATTVIGSGLCLCGIFNSNLLKSKILNFLGFAVCCFSILQTGSRSGVVILIAQFMIVILFWHPQNNSFIKEVTKWIVLFLLGRLAVYFMTNYISVDIVDRLLGRGSLDFFDGTQREIIWAKGIDYFWQHPIMGNGWGTFECHNTFLTMLVDIGLLGNLIFYLIIIRLFINAYKKKDIIPIMILTSGLLPAFFIGAQNKRFFWAAIMLTSLLTYCKGEKYDYQNMDGEIEGSI